MRRRLLASVGLVLVLAIISTVFSILTASSPRWTVQQYFAGIVDATSFTPVVCAAHRSPFYRCGIPRVDDAGHCEVPDCQFYPPSGANRTSCRIPAEVGPTAFALAVLQGTVGGYMECQQVHMAGSLQIAASTFTGFGLLVALVFCVLSVTGVRAHTGAHASRHHPRDDGVATDAPEARVSDTREAKSAAGSHALPYLTVVLIASLVIGATLQVLAQFFAILGLSVNATPNANVVVQDAAGGFGNFGASDWILDIALVRYASAAWLSALLCAAMAGWLYGRTRIGRGCY